MATSQNCNTLLHKVATQRQLREMRAAQSWYLYGLGEVTLESVTLLAPPAVDEITGEIGQCQYTVNRETGRCSCPDQGRLDRLQKEAESAGLQVDPVRCKHALMLPQLLQRHEEEEARKRQPEPAPVSIKPRAQWFLQRRRVRIAAGASL